MKRGTRVATIAAGLAALVLASGLGLYRFLKIEGTQSHGIGIFSGWREGLRVSRQLVKGETGFRGASADVTWVEQRVTAEAPLLTVDKTVFGLSLLAGRDGVHAVLGEKESYLTPDDLLSQQAYSVPCWWGPFKLRCGVDVDKVLNGLARELGTTSNDVWQNARLTRFVVRRENKAPALTLIQRMSQGALASARHLARNLRPDGKYRYEINAITDASSDAGYSLARHAGATLFLAKAADHFHDVELEAAALRAARWLAREMTQKCGDNECVGAKNEGVTLGASALALLAYAELVPQSSVNDAQFFRTRMTALAGYLRSVQRADGEFMQGFNLRRNQPVDVQFRYFTGEAAYALARAHRITGDARDLAAATKALAYIVSHWSFFGSRYLFDAEHWTCQAVRELWQRAPDRQALEFCLRWTEFNRALQNRDGSYGAIDLLSPPRVTQAATMAEGGVATLVTAVRAQLEPTLRVRVEDQVRSALDFLLSQQFNVGHEYLFKNPYLIEGALPGSPVDYTLRIDYPQHAGNAMLYYLDFLEQGAK